MLSIYRQYDHSWGGILKKIAKHFTNGYKMQILSYSLLSAHFLRTKVNFLDHVVSREGLLTDPAELRNLLNGLYLYLYQLPTKEMWHTSSPEIYWVADSALPEIWRANQIPLLLLWGSTPLLLASVFNIKGHVKSGKQGLVRKSIMIMMC